jgi:hypothetical protein
MVNWLQKVATPHPDATPIAVQRIVATVVCIGVTGTPEIFEDHGHFDCVFTVATRLDGLVWSGSALFAPDGRLLVDSSGTSGLLSLEDGETSPPPN